MTTKELNEATRIHEEKIKSLTQFAREQIMANMDLSQGYNSAYFAEHDFIMDMLTAIMLATGELNDSDFNRGCFKNDSMHDYIFEHSGDIMEWLLDAKSKVAKADEDNEIDENDFN